jgi:hypothetical protein
LSKTLGTVEKGKVADLVLLDANPLEDIANTSCFKYCRPLNLGSVARSPEPPYDRFSQKRRQSYHRLPVTRHSAASRCQLACSVRSRTEYTMAVSEIVEEYMLAVEQRVQLILKVDVLYLSKEDQKVYVLRCKRLAAQLAAKADEVEKKKFSK